MKKKITIEKCSCGRPACKQYWLVGMGDFVQGSGFTLLEAQRIVKALRVLTLAEKLAESMNTIEVAAYLADLLGLMKEMSKK